MKTLITLISGFFLLLIIAPGCSQQAPKPEEHKLALDTISETRFRKFPLDSALTKKFKSMRELMSGDPMPKSDINDHITAFETCFLNNVNPGYNFPDLKVNAGQITNDLRIPFSTNTNDTGVSIYYVLVGNNVQVALSLSLNNANLTRLGIYENNILQPGKYLLINPDGNFSRINQMEFNTYAAAFKQQIKVSLRDTTPAVLNISTINSFPTQTFILTRQFRDLVNDNNNDADFTGDPYIGFTWGARVATVGFTSAISAKRCNVMSPISYVLKNTSRSYQRPGNEANHPTERYDKRALNLGRLCPPDCN